MGTSNICGSDQHMVRGRTTAPPNLVLGHEMLGEVGYVDMGGWVGCQAEDATVPYADWNLLRFPDRDQALEKVLDLTMLSDIGAQLLGAAARLRDGGRVEGVRRRTRSSSCWACPRSTPRSTPWGSRPAGPARAPARRRRRPC